MPGTPYIFGITATKLDGTPYTKQVWVMNKRTSETMVQTANSEGKVVFDLANFVSDYSNGDGIIYAIEAYGQPGFRLIRKEPIEDTDVDVIEEGEERLNTASMTINFKLW